MQRDVYERGFIQDKVRHLKNKLTEEKYQKYLTEMVNSNPKLKLQLKLALRIILSLVSRVAINFKDYCYQLRLVSEVTK